MKHNERERQYEKSSDRDALLEMLPEDLKIKVENLSRTYYLQTTDDVNRKL